jgi:N-acetylmuramoyl-L-alanine amidase
VRRGLRAGLRPLSACSCNPSANGTEVYVIPNPREVTRDLGQQLLSYLIDYLGLRNRGLKFANFTVLIRTSMPAALSESAFISNPYEESLLWDPDFRASIAEAHAYDPYSSA